MPLPVSSLSIAVQGIADFLDGQFGEDVVISTDTPQRASDRAKGGDKHFLNLFTYRIMPSGFHSANGSQEPLFIRINTLITPFLTDQDAETVDADLRLLGHAIRVLHSRPVVPGVLPGNSVDPEDFRSGPHSDYRLEAVLQAPTMEELNHIWTTQGGELAYRISAAYEFSLIPIEPLDHRIEAGPVTTSVLDLQPNIDARDAGGFTSPGPEPSAAPMSDIGSGDIEPPTNWLPIVLFAESGNLSNSGTVAGGTASIDVALAGPPGERVALEVVWTRAAGGSTETQPPQVFTIATPLIDDSSAIATLNLQNPADGDVATVLTRPVDTADVPLPASPFANTLSLVTGAP